VAGAVFRDTAGKVVLITVTTCIIFIREARTTANSASEVPIRNFFHRNFNRNPTPTPVCHHMLLTRVLLIVLRLISMVNGKKRTADLQMLT